MAEAATALAALLRNPGPRFPPLQYAATLMLKSSAPKLFVSQKTSADRQQPPVGAIGRRLVQESELQPQPPSRLRAPTLVLPELGVDLRQTQDAKPVVIKPGASLKSRIAAALRDAWKTLFRPVSFNEYIRGCLARYNTLIKRDAAVVTDTAVLRERVGNRLAYLQETLNYVDHSGKANNELNGWLVGVREEIALLEQFQNEVLPGLGDGGIPPGLSLNAMLALLKAEVPVNVLIEGLRRGLSRMEIQYVFAPYEAQGIPLNDQTYPSDITAEQIEPGSVKVLGAGTMNTVSVFTFINDDGTKQPLVFKPLACSALSEMAGAAGISEVKPNLAGRNLAVEVMARHAGVPELVVGARMVEFEGQLGIVMPWVDGASPRETSASMPVPAGTRDWLAQHPEALQRFAQSRGFAGAELLGDRIVFKTLSAHDRRRPAWLAPYIGVPVDHANTHTLESMNRLQWLDVVSGNLDRNPGNYKFQANGAARGYDHDLACGELVKVYRHGEHYEDYASTVAPRVPLVIDEGMRQSLLAINTKALKKALKPYLSQAEVEARLDAVKTVQGLLRAPEANGILVVTSPYDWHSAQATQALGLVPRDPSTEVTETEFNQAVECGYLARDKAAAHEMDRLNPYMDTVLKHSPLGTPSPVKHGAKGSELPPEVQAARQALRQRNAPRRFDAASLATQLQQLVQEQASGVAK